ncbi:helix-turn-helix domain-containing protein [Nocardioides montaniterrae]
MTEADALRRKREAAVHLMAFGARVRELRVAKGVTQEELAHEAGLHRTIVGFIERGEREIGVAKVWPLAEALGTTPADLFV